MLYLLELLIKFKFPKIKSIQTSEFARWLNEEASLMPLILDARSQEEYAVSHIESAQRIEPDSLNKVELEVHRNKPIVVYCSIGYRSAKVAQHLSEKGYKNVFNLSGGIFQWANEEKPIFKDNHRVEIVHPYNSIWGKLLKSKYYK